MHADSVAVSIARTHIQAWCGHDWEKTREMLSCDIHAVVANTQPDESTVELSGVDAYMVPKMKVARLIEPGSLREISAIGNDQNAILTVTFKIGLGSDGSMVTMARSCLYLIDENKKIKEERDIYYTFEK